MSDGLFSSDEYLGRVLPGWMLRKGREHWKGFARATTRVMDGVLDSIQRASTAAMPGQVVPADYATGGAFPNVDALDFVGRDRGLIRGDHEPPEVYAKRLRMWLNAWKAAGTYPGLLYALRAVLAPTPPMVRLVRGGVPANPGEPVEGHWWTLDDSGLRYQNHDGHGVFWPADGSAPEADATVAKPWDWDSYYWAGAPAAPPDPSRLWAIIYAPVPPEITSDDGTYGDGLSVFGEKAADGDKLTIGTDASVSYVATARAACDRFKAAGCQVSHIIVTFSPDAFGPESLSLPDGWWRYHGKIVNDAGTIRRVRARSTLGRYWAGTPSV